jgi:hypothetical protein
LQAPIKAPTAEDIAATPDVCSRRRLDTPSLSTLIGASLQQARPKRLRVRGGMSFASQGYLDSRYLVALSSRLLACGSTLLLLAGLAGCYGGTSAYVEADVPVGVEAYPRTYYDGHVVYWGGDRWYAQDQGVWFYYRSEPPHLRRYRSYWHGNYAPPPRERHYYRPYPRRPYRYAAPPGRRQAPPVRRSAPPVRRSAPPARRH